jgi:peptidoglycan hydrolase CwlO-like protein
MNFLRLISIIFFLSIAFSVPTHAIECEGTPPSGSSNTDTIREFIDKCQAKINSLENEQNTLLAAINVINSKISLAQGQINQTIAQIESLEKDINTLSQVIGSLSDSQSKLDVVYRAKVRQVYKNHSPSTFTLFLSSDSFASFLSRLKYQKVVRTRDQLILSELEKAKNNFDEQRVQKQNKQEEVETLKQKLIIQKSSLANEQNQKQILLKQTQNDEKKYQSLLAQARAELEAIEAIIAGKGKEEEVRDVSSGETIARVIPGVSCNSSGTHLHFIVAQGTDVKNPFSYLKSGIDYQNCSGSSCGSSDGDPFNPSGSWDWPLNPRIDLYQGYGDTWAVKNTWVRNIYKFHNGIDIKSDNLEVKTVQSGKLFRGSYSGSGGCSLKYVRVHHNADNIDTYYLHVNYF